MKKFKKISLKKALLFLLLIVCIGILTIKEQKLETPKRKGFVAVEWGGVEILK